MRCPTFLWTLQSLTYPEFKRAVSSHLDGVCGEVAAGVQPHDAKVGQRVWAAGAAEVAGEQAAEVGAGLDELGGVAQAATAIQSPFWVFAVSLIGVFI